jgi:hypothetical protein
MMVQAPNNTPQSSVSAGGPHEALPTVIDVTHPPTKGWRLAAAAAVTATCVVVAAFVISGRGDEGRPSTGQRASSVRASVGPVDGQDRGTEVPIAATSTAASQDVIEVQSHHDEPNRIIDPTPVVLGGSGPAPVVVSPQRGCFTIAFAGPGGYQGSCLNSGQDQSVLLATNAEAADDGTRATWYIVWPRVPRDAAYVVFTTGTVKQWQRPVSGVSYVSVVASGSEPKDEWPIATAYNSGGTQVGEARLAGS